jgi:hypothetical protein
MDATQIDAHKALLLEQVFHMDPYGAPFSRKNFLRHSWDVLGRFVHLNKRNGLIHEVVRVKECRDLIPRAYFILTAFFGACTYAPTPRAFLREFVGMLDADLVEKELQVCEYARNKNGFFPGLLWAMQNIRNVHGGVHFSLEILPPTPHHSFAFFVLNHSEKINQQFSLEELFGILAVHDSQFKQIVALINSSQTK